MYCRKIAALLTAAVITTSPAVVGAEYWYSDAGQSPLRIDSTKVLVRFESTFGLDEVQNVVNLVERIVAVVPDQYAIDSFVVYALSTGEAYDAFLDSLDELNGVHFVEPYYLSPGGIPMLASEKVCIGFDPDVGRSTVDSVALAHSLVVVDSLAGMPNVFTMRNSPESQLRIVELSNLLHGTEFVRFAHPDFVAAIGLDTVQIQDYYSEYQWHSQRIVGDFNSASVWDFAGISDSSIVVAVIDDGVASHSDLPAARVLPGYSLELGNPAPIPHPFSYHGMACAGLIGASNTTSVGGLTDPNSGVFSISPFVKILPIKIFPDSGAISSSRLAAAIAWSWTHGADVLSNSWSFIDPYHSGFPVLTEAFDVAYAYGRDGRGSPVTFSAGNVGIDIVNYPGRLEQCFAVGASDIGDYRYDYSSYGTGLDVVAPSGPGLEGDVWSLDQMGELGPNRTISPLGCPPSANDIDYYCKFNGTSAAQPLVAGTAALLLAKDSTLTSSQVYAIIRHSAVTDLAWGTITPPSTQYGYGRVDAFRAVLSI
jgi:serine protease